MLLLLLLLLLQPLLSSAAVTKAAEPAEAVSGRRRWCPVGREGSWEGEGPREGEEMPTWSADGWRPAGGCAVLSERNPELRRCLAGSTVAIVGLSHTRNLFRCLGELLFDATAPSLEIRF